MKTEDLLSTAGETFEYGRIYMTNQKKLIRLEVAEKMAKTTSSLVTGMMMFFFLSLFIIFLSIAAGFWLGKIWSSYSLAFLMVTLFYAILGGLAFLFRKQMITNPVLVLILNTVLDDDDSD
jgi:uncharacterized membrane protein YqjE